MCFYIAYGFRLPKYFALKGELFWHPETVLVLVLVIPEHDQGMDLVILWPG